MSSLRSRATSTGASRPAPSLGTARRMLGFAWSADRKLAIWTFVLLSVQAAAASLLGLWLRLFTNAAAVHHDRGTLVAALAVAISISAMAAAGYAGNRAQMTLGDRTQHLLNRQLLDIVGRSPTLAIHQTPAYLRELELLQAESWEFSQAVPTVIGTVTTGIRILITVVLLASITPLLLLLPLFGLPALLLSGRTAGLFNLGNEIAAEPSRRAEMLYELASSRAAAGELRLFRLRGELMRRFTAEHREIREVHVRLAVRAQGFRLIGRAVLLAGYVGAIVLVVYLAARAEVSIGDVAMTAVLAGQVLTLVTGSAELAQWLQRTLIAAARYLYLEHVAESRGTYLAVGAAARPAAQATQPATAAAARPAVPPALTTGIRLEAVSYRYPGRAEDTLREVSVLLPRGATVAIVGDNGAGKTTLVNLLAGLCRPTAGRLLVDDTELAALDPTDWRLRVSAGFQDYARFEFTIQRAVGLGLLPSLDDAAAATGALDRAGAADVALNAPAGLATQLGPSWPGGIDLSGGQWQKLAIGRAMMRTDPLLLLLDEPTAAIDAETEHELFARWTAAARATRRRSGAITVLVSHRFSTVRMADLILVLRNGDICERGSHAELVAAGGVYAELFELQARAYR
jgi:ATP-binding cassette, subfamily B, bacterial